MQENSLDAKCNITSETEMVTQPRAFRRGLSPGQTRIEVGQHLIKYSPGLKAFPGIPRFLMASCKSKIQIIMRALRGGQRFFPAVRPLGLPVLPGHREPALQAEVKLSCCSKYVDFILWVGRLAACSGVSKAGDKELH